MEDKNSSTLNELLKGPYPWILFLILGTFIIPVAQDFGAEHLSLDSVYSVYFLMLMFFLSMCWISYSAFSGRYKNGYIMPMILFYGSYLPMHHKMTMHHKMPILIIHEQLGLSLSPASLFLTMLFGCFIGFFSVFVSRMSKSLSPFQRARNVIMIIVYWGLLAGFVSVCQSDPFAAQFAFRACTTFFAMGLAGIFYMEREFYSLKYSPVLPIAVIAFSLAISAIAFYFLITLFL